MATLSVDVSMEMWLADVRTQVASRAPELLALLDTYLGEARFGREYIDTDLRHLDSAARILEVGAGAMLLSCQLTREGFDVTALEPVGDGFSHFIRMQQIVLERARILGCAPRILDCTAESLSEPGHFDFAFSINVMEHVQDVPLCIENVCGSIKAGASYKFTCPNYFFPYEPHFNIPVFFSKRVTERLLGRRIFQGKDVAALRALWQSLNWINVLQIRRAVARDPYLAVAFNRGFLTRTLERVVSDPDFSSRRSGWMRAVISLLVKLRLHRLVRFLPALVQPTIDCTIRRTAAGAV